MYFEIYHKGNLIKRGNDVLSDLEWSNELMYEPQMSLVLPILYHDIIHKRDEVKVFANDKCFWGVVTGLSENKSEEVVNVELTHVIHEWTYRQISVNNAIKDGNVNVIFKGSKITSSDGKNISASPFDLVVNEVADMTDAKYIQRAGASAWTDKGDKLAITKVNASEVLEKPGTYSVEFSTGSLSVVVDATVEKADGAKTATKNSVTISASPFELTVDEVKSFDASKYIERAMAIAWGKS